MNLRDVVTFIVTDPSTNTREGMASIITAIRERQRINRANTTAIAKATLQIGDLISVSGISPKYINGMQGTIASFNKTRSRADIMITNNRGDYRVKVGTKQYGYPVQCLNVIGVAPAPLGDFDQSLIDFMESV